MATLHEINVKFNSKMTVSVTGGHLLTYSELVLVKKIIYSLNFLGTISTISSVAYRWYLQ